MPLKLLMPHNRLARPRENGSHRITSSMGQRSERTGSTMSKPVVASGEAKQEDLTHTPRAASNPDLRLMVGLAGAAIGAIVALTIMVIVWPAITSTAGVAITAVSAVAGATVGIGGLIVLRRDT